MRLVHVGVSAVSVKVGDFAGNAARLVEVIEKVSKRRRKRWVQKGRRPNHRWDCEAMQIVVALINKILPMFDPIEDEPPPPAKESAPPIVQKPGIPPHRQPDQMALF